MCDQPRGFLTEQIREIHTQSRGTYGIARMHAELVLGEGIHFGKKRVERLMRQAGIEGIYRRKKHFTTMRDPKAALSDDLVNRHFTVDRPDASRADAEPSLGPALSDRVRQQAGLPPRCHRGPHRPGRTGSRPDRHGSECSAVDLRPPDPDCPA